MSSVLKGGARVRGVCGCGCAAVAGLLALGGGSAGLAAEPNTVTFSSGTNEGWSVSGRTTIGPIGNPPPALNVEVLDVFGAEIRDDAGDPRWRGDYRALGSFTLSVDVRVDSISFFGTQVSRDLVVELRDRTNPPGNYPWVSVWARIGTLSAAQPGWRRFTITVEDPNQSALPPGWGGTGAETPLGEPILPPDRTFASVLASVDEVVFTTLVPGFFYGFTDFVMQVDNISLSAVGVECYANCDGSTGTPALSPADFVCFLNKYRAGEAYANCDGSTGAPALTPADFVCFLNKYRAGCP